MTGTPWREIVEELVARLQAFRRQLASHGIIVEVDPDVGPAEQLAKLQQAILEQMEHCHAQMITLQHLAAAREESEKRIRQNIENAPSAIAMFDRDMRYLAVSRRWISNYGLQGREIIGQSHYTIFPEISDALKAVHRRALAGEVVRAEEDRFVRADGSVQWLRWEVQPWEQDDGSIGGIIIYSDDITDLKSAQEQLQRRNRALRLLSDTNQALIRATAEEGLLQQVCDSAVNIGGYLMAWVGYVEHHPAKTVRPAAHAGVESGYLSNQLFSWDETRPEGQRPLGEAIRTRRPAAIEDIQPSSQGRFWRDAALARGYRAGISLPLTTDDEVIGAFTLFRAEPYHFTEDEQNLLKELADDLAFGIITLRTRAARRQAEEALRKSEAYQREFARRTIEAATEGKLIICEREEIYHTAGPSLASWQIRDTGDLEVIRHKVAESMQSAGMDDDRVSDFLLCISEAATNAFKHAGSGVCTLHRLDDAFLTIIADEGPGILAIHLPELALKQGYTTAVSLGMGYKALISLADRVNLATGPEGTVVSIRMALTAPPASVPVFPGVSEDW